jgi:hypothetical protein
VPARREGSRSGRRPGRGMSCRCFCLSRYHHYLSNVQINPFRRSWIHSDSDSQSSRFSVKIFSRSALAGGPENFFFTGAWTRSLRPSFKHAVFSVVLVPVLKPILGQFNPAHVLIVYLFTTILILISHLRQGLLNAQWVKRPENLAKIRKSRVHENALTTIFWENTNVRLLWTASDFFYFFCNYLSYSRWNLMLMASQDYDALRTEKTTVFHIFSCVSIV